MSDSKGAAIDELLDQYIVFGQLQYPFKCARCGAGTDDNSQNFCWCTDRDSSASASSPTWINNVNYPRFVEARGKARQAILALLAQEVNPDKVDRFEVIDDRGRAYVKGSIYGSPVSVELSYQDDGRTLKVFVSDRKAGLV